MDALDQPPEGSNQAERFDLDPVERLRRLVVATSFHGCWPWTGRHREQDGRPVIWVRGRGNVLAARYVWEIMRGPIPTSWEVDHLCENRTACVNPNHLEAVTGEENRIRAREPEWIQDARFTQRLTAILMERKARRERAQG